MYLAKNKHETEAAEFWAITPDTVKDDILKPKDQPAA